jgi:hypothetical protein
MTSNRVARQRERDPVVGKTVSRFCDDYDVSEATFYRWKQAGLSPDVLQPAGPGGRQIITPEAEARWLQRRTALAAVAAE